MNFQMKEFFFGEKILSRKPPYYQTDESPDLWFSPELVWEIRGAGTEQNPSLLIVEGLYLCMQLSIY